MPTGCRTTVRKVPVTRAYLGFMRGQWIESETAFRTAIVADPNNPDVRQMYSQLLGAGRSHRRRTVAGPLGAGDRSISAGRRGSARYSTSVARTDADAERDAALASRTRTRRSRLSRKPRYFSSFMSTTMPNAADDLRALLGVLHRSDAWVAPTIDAYRHPQKRPPPSSYSTALSRRVQSRRESYFGAMVLLEFPGARAARLCGAAPPRRQRP